jgi:diadenosine tetraphosphatase ApaH/serine/threonine PP2A family protein phosphatase
MRIAVLSDIHGNMDAFLKVLEDLDRSNTDAVFCLGDSIGYGSEPEQVIRTLHRRGIPSALGNHELAARDPSFLGWFNPPARQSLLQSFPLLSEGSLALIKALPRHLSAHGCRFVHGFPPDSPTLYLFQVEDRRQHAVLRALPEELVFIGHTHMLDILSYDGGGITRVDFRFGVNPLPPQRKYLINIGAVGQPRDGDPRAKYVIWDSVARLLDIRCVAYDAEAAASKIRAAGLPESHARRLLEPR